MSRVAASAILLLPLLVGCAAWQRIESPERVDTGEGGSLELPAGWVRFTVGSEGVVVTRDGLMVQYISVLAFEAGDNQALAFIDRPIDPSLAPPEMAELLIAEFTAAVDPAELEVVSNEPATVAERSGFRLHLFQINVKGLRMHHVLYGVSDGERYHQLHFFAPALYYFDRDLPVFEELVASFRL